MLSYELLTTPLRTLAARLPNGSILTITHLRTFGTYRVDVDGLHVSDRPTEDMAKVLAERVARGMLPTRVGFKKRVLRTASSRVARAVRKAQSCDRLTHYAAQQNHTNPYDVYTLRRPLSRSLWKRAEWLADYRDARAAKRRKHAAVA